MSLIIKLIGCCFVVAASFGAGCSFSKKLYRRRDFLSCFIVFLNSLETRIRYDSFDIFKLVSICAGDNLNCFDFDTDTTTKPFDVMWKEKVELIPKNLSLTKSDIQQLFEFGFQLGKTDVDGQIKHIALYKTIFAKQLELSEEAITRKSKLYKTMGFFVGTAAALMMI